MAQEGVSARAEQGRAGERDNPGKGDVPHHARIGLDFFHISFRNYFSQGFKCFIVVTLVMVSFTYIFLKSDPSLREEMARNYRITLEKKGNLTPAEVDKNVETAKQYFVIMLTSSAIFGYLVIGAMVTVVTSLFFVRSKQIG